MSKKKGEPQNLGNHKKSRIVKKLGPKNLLNLVYNRKDYCNL